MILLSKSKESALLAPTHISQQNITKSRQTLEGQLFLVLPYSSLQIDKNLSAEGKRRAAKKEVSWWWHGGQSPEDRRQHVKPFIGESQSRENTCSAPTSKAQTHRSTLHGKGARLRRQQPGKVGNRPLGFPAAPKGMVKTQKFRWAPHAQPRCPPARRPFAEQRYNTLLEPPDMEKRGHRNSISEP